MISIQRGRRPRYRMMHKHSISSQLIDYDAYVTLPLDDKLKSKVLEWNINGNYAEYEAIKYYDKYCSIE